MFTDKKLEDKMREKKLCIALSIFYGFIAIFLIGFGAGTKTMPATVAGAFIVIFGIFMLSAMEDCQREYDIMVLSNKIEEIKK